MRLFWILLFCVLAPVAQADEADPPLPALYAVTSVAADDWLNVRAAPDAGAERIGSLNPNARDIEVIAFSRAGQWAMINSFETAGWVAARYLERQPVETHAMGLPTGLQCFGTEPFWDMSFSPPRDIALRTPEKETRHALLSQAPSAMHVDLPLTGFRFSWQGASGPVTAHILPGRCSDGMSDRAYGLHYIDDQGPRAGCCSLN